MAEPLRDYIQKIKTRSSRDTQRSKVYRWERRWVLGWDGPEMTLDECRALVERVLKAFGGRSFPRIADGRGTRIARGSRYRISLPRWARRRPIVLHEVAHALLPRGISMLGGFGVIPGHGPEFVRLFIELLVRYNGEDRRELCRLARKESLKVGPKIPVIMLAKSCNRPR